MRQRGVQMRLEELNSFACPFAQMIVARRSNRCEAPVLPRMFHHSFLESGCMYGASKAVQLHANRSLSWCVGSLAVLGELAVLRKGLNIPVNCVIKTVNSNNAFFKCSTTYSTTPQNGHASHDAHVIAKSCCAPTCLFSMWCVQKQVQLPSSVDATIPCASRCEYVLA